MEAQREEGTEIQVPMQEMLRGVPENPQARRGDQVMDIRVILECERGHKNTETAIRASLVNGSPQFICSSGWEFCDPCGDEGFSTIRSDKSWIKGLKDVHNILKENEINNRRN